MEEERRQNGWQSCDLQDGGQELQNADRYVEDQTLREELVGSCLERVEDFHQRLEHRQWRHLLLSKLYCTWGERGMLTGNPCLHP